MIISLRFLLKRFLYIEAIFLSLKRRTLTLYVLRRFFILVLCFLSLSSTITLFASANEIIVLKSDSVAVGFGTNGFLLQSATSSPISVLVNDDTPKFYGEDGTSLVNISPTVGVTPQIVNFDASRLLEHDSNQMLVWDFGDGEKSTETFVTYEYKEPGKYMIGLEVENEKGKKAKYEKEIEIRDKNEAPIVDATYTTSEKDDYLEVTVDASMTYDIENDPLTFNWELGDDSESNEKIFTHKFTQKGTFVPKITVFDLLGASTVKYLDPITYLGPNIPPMPILNISPTEGYLSWQEGSFPKFIVMLSAKDSFDKDGEIKNYKWTISDREHEEVREGKEVNYEFTKAGEYKITLSVTDDRNKIVETSETILVKKPDPIASANVEKTNGESPFTVHFSSEGSRDFDGSLVNVKWNFGDGTEESTELNPIHTYTKPGAYLPILTVSATDGRVKKTNTQTIIVSENNGPQAIISVLEPVTLGIPNEAMIRLSASDSYDPINNQMLSHSWTWIAHQIDKNKNLVDISEIINKQLATSNEQLVMGEEFSYIFTVPGQYTPILEVKTEDGRTSKINGETITILPSQDPVAIAQITSDKLLGQDTLTINFDASGSYDPKTDGQIVSYLWEFGDGNTSSEIAPVHTYNTAGIYNAKLTVQDNRGFKGIALARTVEVTSSETNTLARIKEKVLKLQTAEDPSALPQDKTFSFSFSQDEEKPPDSTPPQISLWVNNPELQAGETLFFKAHITDDIGIDLVGYKLLNELGNIVLEEVEGAPGNKNIDYYMANIDYVKDIQIPQDLHTGKYKLLLFSKDKADNWLGKADSNEIVSSEINIIGKLNASENIVVGSQDEDTKVDADITRKLDSLLSTEESEVEKERLIELVAADKNELEKLGTSLTRKYLKTRTTNDSYKAILRERGSRIIREVGKPPSYGVPSTTSIVQTITPVVSPVMSSPSGASVNVSVKGSVSSNNVKDYSSVQIKITGETKDTSSSQTAIQSHFTVTCASGRDCSVFDDKLSELNLPRVSITPKDIYGNSIGETVTVSLNENKFKENANQTLEISTLSVTEKYKGSGAFWLEINGSNFDESTNILWNDITLDTKYLDPGHLSAFVPATLVSNSENVQIKAKKIFNGKSLFSNIFPFKVLPKLDDNRYFIFNTNQDLNIEVQGNNLTLERSGGNVYIDKATTVFKEAGDIELPFVISSTSNLNLEIKGEIISSGSNPIVKLYHNNKLISSLVSSSIYSKSNTNSKSWKINLGELSVGAHTIKLSFPDQSGKSIFILDKFLLSFKDESKPRIIEVSPASIYPLNPSDRTLEISGKNFGENPKVYYRGNVLPTVIARSGEATTKQSQNDKIKANLPKNLNLLPNQLYFNISVLNSDTGKSSEPVAVGIRSDLGVNSLSALYKFIPSSPSGRLDVTASVSKDANEAYVGVCDSKGNIIKNPFTDGKFTIGDSLLNASFELPYDLSSGDYYVLLLLKRNTPFKDKIDYSSEDLKKLFIDLLERKITTEDVFKTRLQAISQNEKTSFTIGQNAQVTVNLFGAYEENGSYITQEKKEISLSFDIKGNVNKSNIQTIIDFDDGKKEENKLTANHAYILPENEKLKDYSIYAAIYENGKEIAKSQEKLLYVYKDQAPVAQAKIDTDNYEVSGDLPSKFGFIDKSFDPNDEITNFNGTLDKTIPEKNIWKLYKYQDGTSKQIINSEDLSVIGNKVLSGGKSFVTGDILNPGTYYAHLTVFDEGGKSGSAQSETVQVTVPSQMLLVHASFIGGSVIARSEATKQSPNVFEYDQNGEVKVEFMSDIQVRGNKQPKTLIYKWDFGDTATSASRGSPSEISLPNPVHIYKQSNLNRDRVQYFPELAVTAIWPNGYSESWSSKAGTVTILDKPEFVALDLVPDTTIGNAPLTVNFMVGENSIVKNATIVSYEFYEDVIARSGEATTKQSPSESGTISALSELKSKTFTYIYTAQGEFHPQLKIKTKEGKEYTFNSPIISTNSLLVSSIEVLEPQDGYITNQPIQTFKIKSQYTNPFSNENRLAIRIVDEKNNETITELDPSSLTQTISLSEGLNNYWFELIDSNGIVQKSLSRKIILDTIDPALELFSPGDQEIVKDRTLKIFGTASDENLSSVQYQIDNEPSVDILQGDTENLNENEITFFKEITNLINGAHKLTIRAIDKAGNASSEAFEIGIGDKVFTFDKILSFRHGNFIPTIGGGYYKTKIGSPFKIQRSVWFYGDEAGKNDPYSDISLSITSSYNNLKANITNFLLDKNKEFLNTHFIFDVGDIDGFSSMSEIAYRSTPLNQRSSESKLYNLVGGPNINDPWDVGLHNIEITSTVTSPSGGVLISNTNNPSEISKETTKEYSILIERPINIKTNLEPKIADLNKETQFTTIIEVTDPIGFNLIDKKLKLLLEQNELKKPKLSQAQINNLNIVGASYEVDLKDNTKARVKISFNLKPDILPAKNEIYKLIIPIELPPDNENPDGKKNEKIIIPIRVKASFPLVIESPPQGGIVTSSNLITAKLTNALSDISKFESQNVKFGLSISGSEPIYIKPNLGEEQIFRVNKFLQSGSDIAFSTKLNFDLHKTNNFKDLFQNKEAFGLIDIFSTYTNIKENIEFNGESHNLILLDNPEVLIKQSFLKKEKDKVVLRLTVKNNTLLNDGDELLVKVTPYNDNDTEIIELDETVTNQLFAFTNQNGNPKLTETRKILFPLETKKVKVEIQRNNKFLEEIIKELPDDWKLNFVDRVRQEEKNNRTYIITLDASLKADCEVIDSLLNKKLTNLSEIDSLKKVAGCLANENIAFEIGDDNDKTATYNGKTVSASQLKALLLDLGLITQTQKDEAGYTGAINQAYWKIVCTIEEGKASTLDPSLRLQTADNPLKCTVTHYEGYPDIKYIEDVSYWQEFINGLKARVGEDIRAYVNPTAIGVIASFIAWNAILPVSVWIVLVSSFAGSVYDIAARTNEVKDLWNNSSNLNFTKSNYWKVGYSIGALFGAIPNLVPANVSKNLKVAEVASKLDEYEELQNLILSEQRLVNEITDTTVQTQRQGILDNFATIVEKVNYGGRKALSDVVGRFIDRGFDEFLVIRKLGLTSNENIDLLVRIINRDSLAISLTDKELNDLVFVVAKNVGEERLNPVVFRVGGNLVSGRLPESVRVGRRVVKGEAAREILSAQRSLANESMITFLSELDNLDSIADIELIKALGYDTAFDIERLLGQEIYIFDIPLNGLDKTLPLEGNPNFVKGGLTAGGEFELIIKDGWTGEKLNEIQLKSLGVTYKARPKLVLKEEQVRDILNNSLHPLSVEELDVFVQSLKDKRLI